MTNYILKLIHKSLSDNDLKHILGGDLKIIKYADLAKYKSIDEVLTKERDYAILLYVDNETPSTISGHWVAIARNKDLYMFFDSYGLKPDEEFHFISLKKRYEVHEYKPYLTNLLRNVNYIYNKVKYQNKDYMVDTCGSHCTMFLWYFKNQDMDLPEYQQFMKIIHDKNNVPYDVIAAQFISDFI